MSSTICLVCHERRKLVGVACAECLGDVKPAIAITPEQVRSDRAPATTAVLVDPWGRVHPVRKRTTIGRVADDNSMTILDATISRRHATIELRDKAWSVQDEGSANGTYVEGHRIDRDTPLRDGERVRFGQVSFFFLDGVTAAPDVDTGVLGAFTVRGAPEAANARITIELSEPSGGGGGIAMIGGKQIRLTLPQLELITLLYERARTDSDGFVHPSELMQRLSLESTEPSEDNIRQLVRRLRRVLFNAGIPSLIESRYGAGYRLALLRP